MRIIYKVTNQDSGKVYIGQTTRGLETRKIEHIRESHKNNPFYFHNAIKKYGEDNFKWEVICICPNIDVLNEQEEYYIAFYNSMQDGYNMKSGGLNNLFSDESKRKMSKSRLGSGGESHWNFGRVHTDAAKKKMSRAQSGENNAMYGVHRFGEDNPNYGNKWTEEQRENLRKQKTGIIMNAEIKKKISKSVSKTMKKKWEDPEYGKMMLKALADGRKNKDLT